MKPMKAHAITMVRSQIIDFFMLSFFFFWLLVVNVFCFVVFSFVFCFLDGAKLTHILLMEQPVTANL